MIINLVLKTNLPTLWSFIFLPPERLIKLRFRKSNRHWNLELLFSTENFIHAPTKTCI